MAQFVWFLNRTSIVLYHESRKLFHTVSNLTMAPMDPFWHGAYAFKTFVITSTDSHSSNGNTKIVKREKDINNHDIKN